MKYYDKLYEYGTPNRAIRLYDFKNKERSVRQYGEYMLNRTQQMFHWEGLPDTIPQRNLEILLQTCGHCVIVKDDDKQYAVVGGFSGEPNVYYEPTKYIIANPALPHIKQEWIINEDCILIRNDTNIMGLNPLLSRYCSLLVENDISFRLANINTRISNLISAQDDRTFKSAIKFLRDVESGELGIISSSQFFEGLQVENTTRGYSGVLKDLIEYHQYIRASLYNEIGLDANYNMKRTVVNEAEIEANEDALFPLVDDMLYQRKQAVELWNELYDMNISVELSSVWKANHENEQLSIENVEAEIENLKADTGNIQADTISILTDSDNSDQSENNTSEENDNNTNTNNNNDSNSRDMVEHEGEEREGQLLDNQDNDDDISDSIDIDSNSDNEGRQSEPDIIIKIEGDNNDVSVTMGEELQGEDTISEIEERLE